MKKLLLAILAALSLSVTGCANNSAALDRSPCAGCDFQPIEPMKHKTA